MKKSHEKLLAFSKKLDAFSNYVGHRIAWLALGMVLLMALTVVERYVFSASFIWQQELVRFLHAALFLGAASYTLVQDEHVRVDVFYQHLSRKARSWVNLIGTLLFLLPMCVAIMIFSSDFILTSWRYLEASPEYNGLPGLFLLKSFIWVFCILLILQGIGTICRSWLVISGAKFKRRETEEHHQLL